MIPEIGLLIAAYVFTRMVDMLYPPRARGSAAAQIVLGVCASVTMILAVLVSVDLIRASTTLTDLFPDSRTR
jgi:hypothetical protein